MRRANNEAWVTVAEDEESCNRTLIFLKSLQRTWTNRKIIVLAEPSVSSQTRSRLEKQIDGFFSINQQLLDIKGLDLRNCALIHCYSLTFLTKCVFLDSHLLMIRNSDDLFEDGFDDNSTKVVDCPEASVVALSPSLNTYDDILRKLQQSQYNNGIFQARPNPNIYFRDWIAEQNSLTSTRDVVISLNLETDSSAIGDSVDVDSQPKLVKFIGKSPFQLLKDGCAELPIHAGTFEKQVHEYWNSIWAEISQVSELSALTNHDNRPTNEPIAIIGMSCRFPKANNVDEFWNVLISGEDGQQPVPDDRWLPEQSCVIDPEVKRNTTAGLLKCPVDEFDGKFFQMSRMELLNTDPQQRFLMEVSWEALEDAAIDPHSLKGSQTGIFTGTWASDYKDLMTESGFRGTEFYRTYMGNSFGASSGRLAHFLEVVGPNICTESGCSSSMVAVGLACKSLRARESNLALACGVNLILRSFFFEDFKVVNSPDGRCKTFSSDADGYGRAEGCGILVLKRLSEAIRDGDRIRAVIRGYGQTQEGISYSLGTPTVESESLAMKLALQDANIEASEVSYLEAHGTGTAVGDPLEIKAIRAVYSKDRREPLFVGAVKSNVGHSESCAGITGIIKTVLALENEVIPPNINFKSLNSNITLDNIPAEIVLTPKPWKRIEGNPRRAGINSFGITGTDTHLVIEESPVLPKISKTLKYEELGRILTFSAKSEDALQELLDGYQKYLQETSSKLTDIALTLNTGRAHFPFRTTVVAQNCQELLSKISKGSYSVTQCQVEKSKLCFLFTGQGSQYRGMGKTLYDSCPVYRKNFDICDEILKSTYNLSIREILWNSEEPADELNRTIYSQTSIFVTEYCLLKLWESWGIKPDTVIGHSLGEFAAAVAAGILTLEDAIKLVTNRSRLIDSLPRGKMLVLQTGKKVTEDLILRLELNDKDFWIDLAAVNSPEQTVLAGPENCITAVAKLCESQGIKTIMLEATQAFHSRAMDPILSEYRNVAQSINYSKPTCTFISSVEGKVIEGQIDAEYWIKHTRQGVEFFEACLELNKDESQIFLEVGPQPILLALVTRNVENLSSNSRQFSLKKGQNEWTSVLNALANLYAEGFDVNWKEFHRYFVTSEKVSLPFYPFQRDKYWFSKPKSSSLDGKELHPLLGFQLPIASAEKVFFNYLDLNKKANFLKDHCVGKYIVVPGAAHTDIFLAAAQAVCSTDPEQHGLNAMPMKVKNIQFHTPLSVSEGKVKELEVIVSGHEWSDHPGWKTVKIFSLKEETHQKTWVCHAEGLVKVAVIEPEVADEFKEIRKRCINEFDPKESYKTHLENGLILGPLFQIMEHGWQLGSEVLVQVTLPTDFPDFFCHPVVIDAMLQSLMFSNRNLQKDLNLPFSIGSFTFYRKPKTPVNYIHVRNDGATLNAAIVTLYDETGKKLTTMSGVELIRTHVAAIEKTLDFQELHSPQIFEEIWESDKGSFENTHPTLKNPGICLVLSNGGSHLEAIRREMEVHGRTVVIIRTGQRLERLGNAEISIRTDEKADLEIALEYIKADNTRLKITEIVYLWGMEECQDPILLSLGLLHLIQLTTISNEPPQFSVFTQGAVYIGDQEPVDPAPGTLWGLCRTFRSEYPFIRCRCIDINATEPDNSRNDCMLAEMRNTDEEFQVAYRNGTRFIPRLKPAKLAMKQLPISSERSPLNSIGSSKFNDRSTYLITGGLGGIGLEVAKWMCNSGAKHIVLSGRNAPNDTAIGIIKALNESGNKIIVLHADVGDLDSCKKLLSFISDPVLGLPPLRGVMHAAGCLADEILVNQTKASFETSFQAKVKGGWNLHLLTVSYNLEHFVLFSSISALFGAKGQSNYAAANSYLDSLAHYRNALGLPATAVNWGQWGQVGMAVNIDIPGLSPFTPSEGLKLLGDVMNAGKLQSTIALGDISAWVRIYPWATKYLESMTSGSENQELSPSNNSDKNSALFWKELETISKKSSLVQRNVSSAIANIMKLENVSELNQDQTFEELGLDSLMRIELKNMLQTLLGKRVAISLGDISDYNSITLLSNRILQGIDDGNDGKTTSSFRQLMREDVVLPPHIKGSGVYSEPSEISVVLVTGVTGNLGPYILQNLSNRSQIIKIYCLVRGRTTEEAKNRLFKCLESKQLTDNIRMDKVIVLTGNVSDPNLGIPQDQYDNLSLEVDAVLNIAVISNYIEEYRKLDGDVPDTRKVNVIGAHRILEFATAKKTKWVYQPSTLLGIRSKRLDVASSASDEFDEAANIAYVTSKIVSDRLFLSANDLGIPCKIFRFGIITGDSKTGRQNIKDNHFVLRFLYYLQSGIMPDVPFPMQVMPVDVCANISLQAFFDDDAPLGMYDVWNPHGKSDLEFPVIAKELGYSVRIVGYPEFVKRIVDDGKNSSMYPMVEFYTDPDRYFKYVRTKALLEFAKYPDNYFACENLAQVIPNLADVVESPLAIFKRDFEYAKDAGYLT